MEKVNWWGYEAGFIDGFEAPQLESFSEKYPDLESVFSSYLGENYAMLDEESSSLVTALFEIPAMSTQAIPDMISPGKNSQIWLGQINLMPYILFRESGDIGSDNILVMYVRLSDVETWDTFLETLFAHEYARFVTEKKWRNGELDGITR